MLMLKNLKCMKISPHSMQNIRKRQNMKFLSAYTDTSETGDRIKSQNYVRGLDPKRSKGKFHNFKTNIMSIVAVHIRIQCSQCQHSTFTAPSRIIKTCHRITINNTLIVVW